MAFPSRSAALLGVAVVGLLALASFALVVVEFSREDVALAPWAVALVVATMASIGMVTRCPRCRRSALWWLATKRSSGHFPMAVFRMAACPRCGHPGEAG